MRNYWLDDRKEMLFRDLIKQFFYAYLFFNQLKEEYQKENRIPFSKLDYWVGTEIKKGALWQIKDSAHILFRNPISEREIFEYLFDWTLGSIFHEAMKLKEDIYQIEAYSLKWVRAKKLKVNPKDIEEEISIIVNNAKKNLREEMKRLDYLFEKAILRLHKILPLHNKNFLLIKFLIEEEMLLEKVLGEKALTRILKITFPENQEEKAFLMAEEGCVKKGRIQNALFILQRGRRLLPDSIAIKKRLNELKN
ncbi:MAG: hypothetical protein SV062_12615 [Thermodesulfobacteriota bacterium]|nr:hypothetical protein [Thermodesulfobacteriota bacterium]